MAPLASSLTALKFNKDEAAYIRARIKEHLDDGQTPEVAQERAIKALLAENKEARADALRQLTNTLTPEELAQVFPAYPAPPAPAPKANQKEDPAMKRNWKWAARELMKSFWAGSTSKLALNEMSLDDVSEKLRAFVNGLDTPEYLNYLSEVYPDYFIYATWKRDGGLMSAPDGGQTDERLFKRSYTTDQAAESVTVLDDAIEVKEETTYVPVSQPNVNANINREKENTSMEKKTLIDALVSNAKAPFDEGDRATLETMSVCKLNKILESYKETAPAPAAPAAPATTTNQTAEATPKAATFDEILNSADPATRDSIKALADEAKRQEAELRTKLLENKECPYSAEELAGKNLVELKKLARLANVAQPVADFSGAAGAPRTTTNEFSAPEMPKPWAEKKTA